MAETPQALAERLLAEGQKLVTFFQGLSPEQWETTVYTEGACWTVRQVLVHVVQTEISFFSLIENIASGGSGAPEGFDINRYNERKVNELGNPTVAELLERFEHSRSKTARLVEGLAHADLLKEGRHPFLGVVPLVESIKLVYRHNQIHLREIRRALP